MPTATVAPTATVTVEPTATAPVSSSVALNPSKDNTLYESSTGTVSNGAGSSLFAGNTNGTLSRRALISFDVAGNIPARSTITAVSLKLNMSRTVAGGEPAELHRVLADWGEGTSAGDGQQGRGGPASPGDATWIHRFSGGETWGAPGGDFSPTVSATITVAGLGAYIWASAQMIADVQGWLDDTSTNFGWLLRGSEAGLQTAKRFDSREASNPSNRPELTIEFTPPA
jgi:hypothetical protein